MLQQLRVKNLAIVENAHVEFAPGLNVITGETGAGKSILVGALGLVLGERADKTLIRAGENQCGVEATFQLADPAEVDAVLDELGLVPCEDGRLIVRRLVTAAGAGKNFVNDCATTVQVLKRIGDLLVDMHGPHDHQSLLHTDFQLDLLDAFGHLWKQRAAYEDLYDDRLALEAQRRELDGDDRAVSQQIDMLQFQVKELQEAELEAGMEEALKEEHARVANAQQILEQGEAACQALTEADESAFNTLVFARTALGQLADALPEAAAWSEELESISVQLQELARTIGSAVQTVEGDPNRLEWLEDRLALLQKLKRKYGGSVEAMLAFLDDAAGRLRALETRGERIAELEQQVAAKTRELETAGGKLRQARTKTATALARDITAALHGLGFAQACFEVALAEAAPRPSGLDEVEFGFAPNVGEPMRPLRAIASSGEISRVMLAVKAVLAGHDKIPVLVFDEIDANVGGEIGNAVGARLGEVAAGHQVLCITHLPQVAVYGASHFVVAKHVSGGRTRTEIVPVADDARAEEIARMLGGKDLTSVTLAHAREMLARRPTAG